MKIRHPFLIQSVGLLGSWTIRAWMATVRMELKAYDPSVNPLLNPSGRYIYAFWHENILVPSYTFRNCGASVLISNHADGEMIAQIVKRLGFGLVRGSTNKGGAKALLELIRNGTRNHLAITPDGPRGPRRIVQPGIAMLAAATGLPVVPLGMDFRSCWRAKSWDRFAVPKPFSRVGMLSGPAIQVPPTTDFSIVSDLRRRIEFGLAEVTRRAEYWREHGKFSDEPFTVEGYPSRAA